MDLKKEDWEFAEFNTNSLQGSYLGGLQRIREVVKPLLQRAIPFRELVFQFL